jgi:hypothetical protein
LPGLCTIIVDLHLNRAICASHALQRQIHLLRCPFNRASDMGALAMLLPTCIKWTGTWGVLLFDRRLKRIAFSLLGSLPRGFNGVLLCCNREAQGKGEQEDYEYGRHDEHSKAAAMVHNISLRLDCRDGKTTAQTTGQFHSRVNDVGGDEAGLL